MNVTSSRLLRLLVVAIVTASTVVFLCYRVNVHAVVAQIANASPGFLLAGFAVFLLGHFIRLLRYHGLWRWPVDRSTFSIVALHGAFSYIFPLRLGELVLPSLSRVAGLTGFRRTLGGLLYSRAFDFMLISLLALLIACSLGSGSMLIHQYLPLLANLSFVLPVVLILVIVLAFLLWGLGHFMGMELSEIVLFAAQSFILWFCVFAYNWLIAAALGIQLSSVDVMGLVLLTAFSYFIPLQGFANLGLHEAIWYLVLHGSGVGATRSGELAVSSHALLICFVVLLGVVGSIMFRLNRN